MEFFVGVLGSGSTANSYVVRSGNRALMIDCGFSLRETRRRLRLLGVWEKEIQALILTHSHDDHIRGTAKVSAALGLPVFHPRGMPKEYWDAPKGMKVLEPYNTVQIAGWDIFPFTTSHDSGISVGYTVSSQGGTLTLITDTGQTDDTMLNQAALSDVLVLESNYSSRMLDAGSYPDYLKHRIRGRTGHLSNSQAGGFLAQVSLRPSVSVQEILLVHLSDNNNSPHSACDEVGEALKKSAWEKLPRHIASDGEVKTAVGEPRIWVLPKMACWGWRSPPAPSKLP